MLIMAAQIKSTSLSLDAVAREGPVIDGCTMYVIKLAKLCGRHPATDFPLSLLPDKLPDSYLLEVGGVYCQLCLSRRPPFGFQTHSCPLHSRFFSIAVMSPQSLRSTRKYVDVPIRTCTQTLDCLTLLSPSDFWTLLVHSQKSSLTPCIRTWINSATPVSHSDSMRSCSPGISKAPLYTRPHVL